jgi:formate dehydrogenase iron-sulfur subunit
MTIRVFVPADSSALSVGAGDVALAIAAQAAARGSAIELVRNGSRGLSWLEPLVEVATPAGRVAYGPVTVADVPGLLDAGFLAGADHPLALGLTDEIPYLKKQERLTFARVGITDPLSLADYAAHGGFAGLRAALSLTPGEIVAAVTESGLRGRGGAAFPAGIKWQTVLAAAGDEKYVVCNADEGDSGTFSDRLLLEGDPFCLIEGMLIAGLAVGARKGYIYLRSEYPHAWRTLNAAILRAREAGLLGDDVLGSGRSLDIEARLGGGAYICGEETALLESIEGRRGQVRAKPPLPAIKGLFGKPTVINNVITLASVPIILARGATFYRDYGMGRSRGTLPFQLAGNVLRGGLVEKAFGLTLDELLNDFGGGTASGRPIRAVQVGGPLGAYVPAQDFDLPLDYEAFAARGAMLGHGGVVVFDDTVDMGRMARFAMEFCAAESCGKCTPCRIGSTRGVEVIERILAGEDRGTNLPLLEDLCTLMIDGSLCAMGGMTPYPVLSLLKHFPADFGLADK